MKRLLIDTLYLVLAYVVVIWIAHDFIKPEFGTTFAEISLFAALGVVSMAGIRVIKAWLWILIVLAILVIKLVIGLLMLPFVLIGMAFQFGKNSMEKNK